MFRYNIVRYFIKYKIKYWVGISKNVKVSDIGFPLLSYKSGLARLLRISFRSCATLHTTIVPGDISGSSVRPSSISKFYPFPDVEESSRNWFAESRTRNSPRSASRMYGTRGKEGGLDGCIQNLGKGAGERSAFVVLEEEREEREEEERTSGRWKFRRCRKVVVVVGVVSRRRLG